LEYPQYTRPSEYKGWIVPDVLQSGNHAKIEQWRRRESLKRTYQRRPDLLKKIKLSAEDKKNLEKIKLEDI
jgi:tRNA (guanine37-N1)-methyltransferase